MLHKSKGNSRAGLWCGDTVLGCCHNRHLLNYTFDPSVVGSIVYAQKYWPVLLWKARQNILASELPDVCSVGKKAGTRSYPSTHLRSFHLLQQKQCAPTLINAACCTVASGTLHLTYAHPEFTRWEAENRKRMMMKSKIRLTQSRSSVTSAPH